MVVDNNMHWMPETLFDDEDFQREFLRQAPRNQDWYFYKTNIPGTDEEQLVLEQPRGTINVNYTRKDVDSSGRLEAMDKGGVDKAIMRIPIVEEWTDLNMCRKLNDMMFETRQRDPDRLKGLAIIPPYPDKDVFNELERCVKDLGCVGVEMAAHYGNRQLDDEIFRPYWAKIAELDVPVVVHHTPLPADYDSIYTSDMRRMMGRCFAQLNAVTRLLSCGLYEEHPNLRVIHSYMGGGFFAFNEIMMMRRSGKYKEEMKRVNRKTSVEQYEKYLRENVFFDMCHANPWGKKHMEFAIDALGAEHVLFGTSYPIRFEWAFDGVEFMNSLDISDEERALVLGGNAERLFKL